MLCEEVQQDVLVHQIMVEEVMMMQVKEMCTFNEYEKFCNNKHVCF